MTIQENIGHNIKVLYRIQHKNVKTSSLQSALGDPTSFPHFSVQGTAGLAIVQVAKGIEFPYKSTKSHSISFGISVLPVQFVPECEGLLLEQWNGDFIEAANFIDTLPPGSSTDNPWPCG